MAALAALFVSLSLAVPVGAGEHAPASKDLESAQEKANKAAQRLAEGQSALAGVEDEVGTLNGRISATRSRLAVLRGEVRDLSVSQYVQGGDPTVWIVQADLGQAARSRALLRHVTMGRADALDEYRVVSADLEDSQAALERRLGEQRKVVEDLRKDEASVAAELDKLAAAQQAYEARLATQQADAERAAAERARADTPPVGVGPVQVRPPPGPVGVRVPRPGLGGGTQVIGSGAWVCPVQGPRAFTNDWGQPRSGGRRHQGTDILSPRGTPIVANVSGTVSPHSSSLGGISYYLRGDDGNTYFGTHLDSLSGVSGRVSAGTVIGRNGNSGNARGGPTHLHFEIHPGGGGAVNPYPTVARYC